VHQGHWLVQAAEKSIHVCTFYYRDAHGYYWQQCWSFCTKQNLLLYDTTDRGRLRPPTSAETQPRSATDTSFSGLQATVCTLCMYFSPIQRWWFLEFIRLIEIDTTQNIKVQWESRPHWENLKSYVNSAARYCSQKAKKHTSQMIISRIKLVTTRNDFGKWPTWRTILLFYNTFITVLYMFRATLCSSSGDKLY
jgi:hypothetical protein